MSETDRLRSGVVLSGADLIAAERRRQVEVEGWTSTGDDAYTDSQLCDAAAAYLTPPDIHIEDRLVSWPWDIEWFKPGDRVRELAKAGALIAAEIDRILRARGDQGEDGR